jgi:hypothetical protein
MLGEQPVEQIGAADPKVRQRVIVHRHPTAEPAIGIVAVAQPFQSARAADALAGGIKPQRQQKPRRNRRMSGPVIPGLDPILKLAQVKPHHIGPDQTGQVVGPDQAVDVHRQKLDLIAMRLTQARGSGR